MMDEQKLKRFVDIATTQEIKYLTNEIINLLDERQLASLDKLFNFQISLKVIPQTQEETKPAKKSLFE